MAGSYVYIESEHNLYTVGFYSPDGKWHAESDFPSRVWAAERVHYLNGGNGYGEAPDPAREHINGKATH